jgi:hypothetical protein
VVPSPNVGSSDNFLNAVSATSSTDVWAVGYDYAGDPFPVNTLILHWDGASWSVVESPSPGGAFNVLNGVSAFSGSDAWAVGYTQNKQTGNQIRSLIMHWDGATWTEVDTNTPKNVYNSLHAVRAVAPDDVWAVGNASKPGLTQTGTLTLHWDGSTWNMVRSPTAYDPLNGSNDNDLWSVDAASGSDIWSVGNFGDWDNANGDNSTLSIHWDGSAWARVKSPNPKPIDYFRGVSVSSPTEIWAGGYKMPGRYSNPRALVATNDGHGWTVIPTDTLPSTFVYAVDAVSSDEVWIGGAERPPDFGSNPTVDIWDGTGWTVIDQPTLTGSINGIASPASGKLWAVGFQIPQGGTTHTLIERVTCG